MHGDFYIFLAVFHAGGGRKLAVFGFFAVIDKETIGIGQLKAGQIFVGQNVVILDQIIGIEDIGDDGIDLIRLQRLGGTKGHRAVDVIPDG